MDNKQESIHPESQQPAPESVLDTAPTGQETEQIATELCVQLPVEETVAEDADVKSAQEVVTEETIIAPATQEEDVLSILEEVNAEETDLPIWEGIALEEMKISPVEETDILSELENTDLLLDDAAVDALIAELTAQSPITAQSQDDLWENQEVDAPVLAEEIGPDEQAIAAAGLTHPEDLEFEKILEEAKLEDSYTEPQEEESEAPPVVEAEAAGVAEVAEAENAEEEVLDESEEEEEPEDPMEEEMDMQELDNRTPSKRRPRKRSTYGFFGIPHILTTVVWLAIIVFIGVGTGKMIWNVAADMLAFGRPNQVITITITSDDDLDDIAQKLYDTGLIKYPGIFKFYGQLANAEKKIKAGTYELNAIYDYNALVKNMAGYADRVDTKVTIPEGKTCAQIFRILEKAGVCTVEALEEAAMNADLSSYWFLEGIDRSNPNCLEGYLFPDTYNFYLDLDATSVLKKMLSNFNKRFNESMVAKVDELNETLASMMRSHGLPESYIKSHLLTVQDVIIIASMIEKETAGDEESYYIASVIYNRLTNPGEYPYLNIDATLVYITGNSPLTQEDLKIDSPYNTYLYKGLIPGPISNPGLASLNAALSPENTEYYYYALDPSTGEHKFFKTYKAHQNFLESLKKGG